MLNGLIYGAILCNFSISDLETQFIFPYLHFSGTITKIYIRICGQFARPTMYKLWHSKPLEREKEVTWLHKTRHGNSTIRFAKITLHYVWERLRDMFTMTTIQREHLSRAGYSTNLRRLRDMYSHALQYIKKVVWHIVHLVSHVWTFLP